VDYWKKNLYTISYITLMLIEIWWVLRGFLYTQEYKESRIHNIVEPMKTRIFHWSRPMSVRLFLKAEHVALGHFSRLSLWELDYSIRLSLWRLSFFPRWSPLGLGTLPKIMSFLLLLFLRGFLNLLNLSLSRGEMWEKIIYNFGISLQKYYASRIPLSIN
jgi:hypothetical protein